MIMSLRCPLTKEEDEIYENTKIDLQEKVMEKTKGIMFRSKAKWYELGERNTKYFFSLEKTKYNAKTCYKAFDESGNILTQPEDILRVQREFYESLYQKDEEVEFTLRNVSEVKVPHDLKKNSGGTTDYG